VTESDSALPEDDESQVRLGRFKNMPETSDVSTKYFIYILFSLKDKKLYIGFTTNLDLRLIEHTAGRVTSTKDRRPLKLIYHEMFTSKPRTHNLTVGALGRFASRCSMNPRSDDRGIVVRGKEDAKSREVL
ncbi:MAG: GIY-YIG nuclease family protein, partial [Candidatus Levyibacteriota bacterium]